MQFKASSADMSWKAIDRYSRTMTSSRNRASGFWKTPDAILKEQLKSWDKVVAAKGPTTPPSRLSTPQ